MHENRGAAFEARPSWGNFRTDAKDCARAGVGLPSPVPTPRYSWRSATSGSTRDARYAGSHVATSATRASAAIAIAERHRIRRRQAVEAAGDQLHRARGERRRRRRARPRAASPSRAVIIAISVACRPERLADAELAASGARRRTTARRRGPSRRAAPRRRRTRSTAARPCGPATAARSIGVGQHARAQRSASAARPAGSRAARRRARRRRRRAAG